MQSPRTTPDHKAAQPHAKADAAQPTPAADPNQPSPPPPVGLLTEEDARRYGIGPEHIRKLAENTVSMFVQIAGEKMRETGGRATATELRDYVSKFIGGVGGPLEAFYKKMSDEWNQVYVRGILLKKRKHAFYRLIVHNFSVLFKAENVGQTDPNGLSRDNLPAFITAIKLILGDEVIAAHEEQCGKIVEDLKTKFGDTKSWHTLWDEFYDDPRSQAINVRSLYMIAAYFKRWDIRKQWFIQVMNHDQVTIGLASNAYVVIEGRSGTNAGKFTEIKFQILMQQLFTMINPQSIKPEHKKLLRDEFGGEFVPVLSNLYYNISGHKQAGR
jgi:hypothetical protein